MHELKTQVARRLIPNRWTGVAVTTYSRQDVLQSPPRLRQNVLQSPGVSYSRVRPKRVSRTREYVLLGCGALQSTSYLGVAYSRVNGDYSRHGLQSLKVAQSPWRIIHRPLEPRAHHEPKNEVLSGKLNPIPVYRDQSSRMEHNQLGIARQVLQSYMQRL